MNLESLVNQIKEKIEPAIKEINFELCDIQYRKENGGWALRVFADNSTRSINLDECAVVSHAVSDILDEAFPDLPAYNLEVSSPGLDRLLKNDGDFLWAMGKTLKVKFIDEAKKKQVVEGKILALNEADIELEISKKLKLNIPKDSIEEARRVMKFDEIAPKKDKNSKEVDLDEEELDLE